jgi:O-antigen/teichoic acid export membrane protein
MKEAGLDCLIRTEDPKTAVNTAGIRYLPGLDDMVKHSLMMVTFGILSGGFSYLYQLVMGILLTPGEYGTLFSLNSLFIIMMVFSQTITISVAKYTSMLNTGNKPGDIAYLWRRSVKTTAITGIIAFALLAMISPLLARFLNLENAWFPVIIFMSILFTLVIAVNYGVMQGLQRFWALGITNALVPFLKLALGIILIYLGASLYGALAAIPVSLVLILAISFRPIRDVMNSRAESTIFKDINKYAWNTLLSVLGITILINMDAVLAKHYLTTTDAGSYSAISVLGKVSFYASTGIVGAMFPKTSALYESGRGSNRVLCKGLAGILLITGLVVLVYGLFPREITGFLFSSKYAAISPYLLPYSLAMALFSIAFLMVHYLLSLRRMNVGYGMLAAAILQIIIMVVFHDGISQLVNVMLLVSFITTIITFLFYFTDRRAVRRPI